MYMSLLVVVLCICPSLSCGGATIGTSFVQYGLLVVVLCICPSWSCGGATISTSFVQYGLLISTDK